jgi:hypothetical protein
VVPDAQAGRDAAGTQIGLMVADGSTRWLPAHPVSSSSLGITVCRSISRVWITGSGGAPAEPTVATVFSPHGAKVVRSVAAIAGWSATWQPRHGPAARLAVQQDGLVQAVDVPAGRGVLTWSYTPPGWPAGLVLSLTATALIALLAFAAFRGRIRSDVPAS